MNWNAPESIHLKNILEVEKKNKKQKGFINYSDIC